jgi:hypothetical protein
MPGHLSNPPLTSASVCCSVTQILLAVVSQKLIMSAFLGVMLVG